VASSNIWLPSAARTTTQTSADLATAGFKNLTVTLDMTVVGTGSVTLTINGKDQASGKYRLILAGAAVVTNVTNVYKVTQNIVAAAANVSAIDVLPEFIQLVATANNANPATYSVGYDLI
jgi:hypothetical protein